MGMEAAMGDITMGSSRGRGISGCHSCRTVEEK